MTRTQACRDQLGWMVENCPLDRTSIIPIERAHNFCTKYVEISTLSTDAIQPLAKIKDVKVQERVVAALKIMIDAGKKPTRRDVVTRIQIERPFKHITWKTKIRQNEKKITEYQGKIHSLEYENKELRKCIERDSRKYGKHQESTPAVIQVDAITVDKTNVPDGDSFGVTEPSGKLETTGINAVKAKLAKRGSSA